VSKSLILDEKMDVEHYIFERIRISNALRFLSYDVVSNSLMWLFKTQCKWSTRLLHGTI